MAPQKILLFILLSVLLSSAQARGRGGGRGGGHGRSSSSRSSGSGRSSSESSRSYKRTSSSRNTGHSSGRSSSSKTNPSSSPSSSSPGYTYRLDLGNGKKYVGSTSSPSKRLKQHYSGNGSKYTQKNRPQGVDYVKKHPSEAAAKSAETREYYSAKRQYGDGVRGAGNTRSGD
jgi:predicted GIY-YIG superfamily endonuclease